MQKEIALLAADDAVKLHGYVEKSENWDENIKKYGQNTVVLMQVGSFYEIYSVQNESLNLVVKLRANS